MVYVQLTNGGGYPTIQNVNNSGSFTFRNEAIAGRAILYVQINSSFNINFNWNFPDPTTNTSDDNIYYYYVGNVGVFSTTDLSTTTTGDNPPPNWSSVPNFDYNIFTGPYTGSSGPISVTSGNYFGLLYNSNTTGPPISANISSFPDSNGNCVLGNTKIKMKNGEEKEIKDIKRGDEILEDIKSGKSNKVANLYKCYMGTDYVMIPKGLLGNKEELNIIGCHPIWINDDKNRIIAAKSSI